jgi:hypothetical protein
MRRIRAIAAPHPRHAAGPLAWLIALAIILQGSLALPLTLRMAADMAAPLTAGLDCGGMYAADAADDTAPLPQDHAAGCCLLCQGAVGPLLLPAAPGVAAPAFVRALIALVEPAARLLPATPSAYASRAPPGR